ncbi:MAG: OmpA family protein [Pseudomonadota bacterium]
MNGKILKAFCLVLGISLFWTGKALPTLSVTVEGGGMSRDVYLGMTKRELILKLGAPDTVKSSGLCFAYDVFDMSVFMDSNMRVGRIYLGRNFNGTIKKENGEVIRLKDIIKVTSVTVMDNTGSKEVSLWMSKEEVSQLLGKPSRIDSGGKNLRYDKYGVTLSLDEDMRVEQITLDKDFKGGFEADRPKEVGLGDLFKKLGAPKGAERLTYSPSLLIHNEATVELEDKAGQPQEKEHIPFPLEYRGDERLYELHSKGIVMKYKYAMDDIGISFYLDHNKSLYTTVLYPPPIKVIVEKRKGAKLERICFEMIHFDFDRYNIKPQYIPVLTKYIQYLKENKEAFVVIQGHTDAKGTDIYNQGLSDRRSKSVYTYFVNNRVDTSQLKMEGFGEVIPIAPNATAEGRDNPEGRALNRRAQFEILKTTK